MILEIGSFVKVRIPCPIQKPEDVAAECPWATVVDCLGPDRILGRIDNHLCATDLHGVQFGDVLELELKDSKFWEPVFRVN